ncbi:PAAR domain-containing protein [Luteimonas abyssi]|uniref:PAAR domain-containing protein n=1 Tax=Luteimonas abyssi TaxID=1247514 RepID=UPI000737BC5B|nr:PAAR domain-containing protein [Luteimonas abyssi]
MKDDARPHRPPQPRRIVPLAQQGARTNLGSTVATASSGMRHHDVPLACAGDTVTHPHLGDARILTRLDALQAHGQPVACAGSLTTRPGEYILDPGQHSVVAIEYDDGSVALATLGDDAGTGA